jgi:hypothetical protein
VKVQVVIIFLFSVISCGCDQNVNISGKNKLDDFTPIPLTKLTGSFDGSYLVQGNDKIPRSVNKFKTSSRQVRETAI